MRDWRADIRARLAAGRLDPSSEAEIVEEIAQHLEDQLAELRSRGVSEGQAVAQLLHEVEAPGFTESLLARRRARRHVALAPIGAASGGGSRFGAAWQDLRYGVRSLGRAPVFTIVAVASLALGIGATTAIFGLLNAVLLERLAVARPEQLIGVQRTPGTGRRVDWLSYREYDALSRTPGLPKLAASTGSSVTASADNFRDYVYADIVTGNFFEMLGVRPLLGRAIDAHDDATATPAVVLGETFWRNHLAGDPGAVGRTVSLNGHPFTVVGVLPSNYHGLMFGGEFSMAIPLGAGTIAGGPDVRGARDVYVSVVGRLLPGTQREGTAQTIDRAFRQCCLAAQGGGRVGDSSSAQPLVIAVDASRGLTSPKIDLRGQYRQLLEVLMAGVAIVLLIACANVGDLLLARAAARERELAVRTSMGATRGRLIQQLLTESVELAIAGGVLGWFFAWLGTRTLSHNLPPIAANLSERITLRPSVTLLAFTAAVTLGSTLLFGVLPALRATRADVMTPLRDAAKRGGSGWSLDRGLVVVQVSLALVLLCAATLFVATLRNLQEFDGGYRTTRVLLAYVDTRGGQYERTGITPIYPDLLARLSALPGVTRAAASTTLPVMGGMRSGYRISIGGYTPQPDENMLTSSAVVTPGYFATTGVGLRAGREFDSRDLAAGEPVTIVNVAFVKRFFSGRDPIGGTVSIPGDAYQRAVTMRVVGVANDARYEDLRTPASEMFYIPAAQAGNIPYLNFALRTTGDPNDVAPMVTREIAAVTPELRVRRLIGVEQALDDALSRERLSAALASLFGLFALGLAAVGLYGVVAYNVARRTAEIGVRMALGARPVDALWLVVKQTLTMTGIGVAIGIPLAIVAARAIGAQLYGIGAGNPWAMIAAAGLLATAGAVASVVPARRASRVDPVEALRAE
jgi:putative ABC transport system permease protein